MSYIYTTAMKVPTWVVLLDPKKQKHVFEWFANNSAEIIDINLDRLRVITQSYKNQGYFAVFTEKEILLPEGLVDRAFGDWMREYHSPNVQLQPTGSYNMNRKMMNNQDYSNLAVNLLNNQPDLVLSQVFRIGERVHDKSSKIKRTECFVSLDLAGIPSRLSDKVITIGDATCTIDLSDIKGKDQRSKIEDRLEQFFA